VRKRRYRGRDKRGERERGRERERRSGNIRTTRAG